MAVIKKYTKKDGSTAYMFNTYLGVDPLTGKSKRTTRRGFKTPKEAKLALAQLQLEYENNDFVKQDYSTFKQIYELWFEQYKNTVKDTTAYRIERFFTKQIIPAFGDKKIDKITPMYCQKIINDWSLQYKLFGTMAMYTSRIFKFALNQNIISQNPMDKVILPRKQRTIKNKESQNFLDKKQLIEFLKEAERKEEPQYFTIFHLLAYSGMRKSELFALTWSDINFQEYSLSINKNVAILAKSQYISTTKTSSSDRIISLDPKTIAILKKWKFEQKKLFLSRGIALKKDEEQLVFSNTKNDILTNSIIGKKLKKYKNVHISPHGFRHTHASLLFESGATIKQVQERLGHSDIKTTLNIYTHVTKDVEKNVGNNFLKYMNS
ncbi:site-specific integrase [Candidatus Enterococcus huntleyi]|uniref:site-specific integrase n=1 Tax=Candidatus Enterococcus huntleyi TaxID=1857217 RepID=UPI00137B00B7|nr:site-specific integrase [Enterococcus sp. JM4C]